MAKYIAIFVSIIFFIISVNSAVLEPSAEIIRNQDAEEGKYYQRVEDLSQSGHQRRFFQDPSSFGHFLETLVCPNPKTGDNTVEEISGDPPHMSSEVKVTCDAGKHFTGRASHKSSVTLRCTPLPNPNYEVEWSDIESHQLMYDFNCTSDPSSFAHQRRFLDYLVCPNPKTEDNTVEEISGDPPHMNSQVKVTCDAGKHFTGRASHKSAVTLTCIALPNPNYEVEWQDNESYHLMYNFNCTSDPQKG